ncbi:MAG: hypothetical protein A3K19_33375 [Lentisphaerae bacterium RIFOXYB12_FULL_65_16]|nr:MAG: hypothetical protein A3K18_05860 [Lentisphaerae bacterium RIFOXYA12_64_32]OGV86922.1 MAG: hypothetical protein A3K19_33375 [Lentisphaerae bacterium RIFOXYB12_FULL_65_16]
MAKNLVASVLAFTALLVSGLASAADPAPPPGPTFSGDTNRPDLSLFIPGEPVELTFSGEGFKPGEANLALQLRIVDALDSAVATVDRPLNVDDKGAWQLAVPAPCDKLGFYRVHAKLSNGMALPALVTRPAGFLTYAVVPDPATRPLYPQDETFFGMQGGYSPKVQAPAYLGVRWMLGGYGWGRVEDQQLGEFGTKWRAAREKGETYPARGFDWCRYKVNGEEKPWVVYTVPNLYGPNAKFDDIVMVPGTRGDNKAAGALTPEGEKHWRNYCLEVGKAYPVNVPGMNPRLYEITWEPCYPWGYKGTPEQLVRIYEIAYQALHESDPQAFVIGPCEANADSPATAELFRLGLGKFIDGFSHHPYIGLPPERNELVAKIRRAKETMRRILGHELPLHGTEQGYPTEEKVEKEIIQARGLIRANLIMMGEGYRFNFAFYAVDYHMGGEAGYGFNYNLDPKRNWGPEKWGPKPVAPAYAAMTWLLEGHRPSACLDWLGATALGYVLERPGSIVLALWDYGDEPRRVRLATGADKVTLYDWMGNGRELATDRGDVELTLTGEPQYLKGVSPEVWGSTAHKYLDLPQGAITAFPGGRAAIAGTVRAKPGEALACNLGLSPEPKSRAAAVTRPQAVAAGEAKAFAEELTIPADLEPGVYGVAITLEKDGRPFTAGGCRLDVQPPVSLARIEPVFEPGGKVGMKAVLRDLDGAAHSGRIQTRFVGVPEGQRAAEFQLPTNGETTVNFDCTALDLSPLVAQPLEVTVAIETGYSSRTDRRMNFWRAPRLAAAPKLDGTLDDWAAVPGIPLRGVDRVVRSPDSYSGHADSDCTVRYAWDDTALYVAFEVLDDVFMQRETGFNTWRDDCLQLGFNLDPGKQYAETGNELVDREARQRYSEIDLALTPQAPEAYRTASSHQQKRPVALLKPEDLTLAMVKTDVGEGRVKLVYEAAIPWRTLGADTAPAPDTLIGVAGTVNDRDTADQRDPSALGFFPLKTPKEFGLLWLGRE